MAPRRTNTGKKRDREPQAMEEPTEANVQPADSIQGAARLDS